MIAGAVCSERDFKGEAMEKGMAVNAAVDPIRAHELLDMGLAYIRAAIRANLAEVDGEIAAAGIFHPAWSRSMPPPQSVAISVMPAHAPVVTVEFTAREIQDCWRGVECADACRKVRSFADAYSQENFLKKGSDPFFPAHGVARLTRKGI